MKAHGPEAHGESVQESDLDDQAKAKWNARNVDRVSGVEHFDEFVRANGVQAALNAWERTGSA